MSAKQDRAYVRTPAQLEQKLGLKKFSQEVLGLIDDTRKDVESVASTLRSEISEQYTTIMRDTTQVMVEALQSYVQTGDLETYKETVHSQLTVMANAITANVESIESNQRTINEHTETLGEHGEAIETNRQTIEEYREASEAGISVLTDQVNLYAEKTTQNETQIETITTTLTEQGEEIQNTQTELTEYKTEANAEIALLSDKIDLNVATVEEHSTVITEHTTTLEQHEEDIAENSTKIEDYKKTAESDFQMLSDEINISVESSTELIKTTADEINNALELYVQTADYERYKETVKTSLQVLENEILLKFQNTTEQITTVDGEMQSQFNQLYNYISIVGGVMTFGSSENAVTLTIENDKIAIKRNGVECGYWDENNFYTGNIVIRLTERLQIGSFAFIPRSNGNVSFLKVGG